MKAHLVMRVYPHHNATVVVEGFTSRKSAWDYIEKFAEADRKDGWTVTNGEDPVYGKVIKSSKGDKINDQIEYVKTMDLRQF